MKLWRPQRQQALHDEILILREGVFFVPVSENQEALDAFLLLHGILYILQFTVTFLCPEPKYELPGLRKLDPYSILG